MVLLILYITIGSFMEVKKFSFGHETGVIIILGAVCSSLVYATLILRYHETVAEASIAVADSFKFPNELFFEVLLPLIIFATGYNMRRQKFFENFTNISKFGLLGTFLTFVFFAVMVQLLFDYNDGYLWAFDFDAEGTEEEKVWFKFKLDTYQILYICSIYCSSDIIAAVTIIKFDEQPTLFSLILGEGLFNDAVAIILY